MAISWNEIRNRSIRFVKEWQDEKSEEAAYQIFWNQFFDVFGINQRRVSTFQAKVRLLDGSRGKIDLFWPNTLLVEHKTAGESLDKAYQQAINYTFGIDEEDLPKYILVTDYQKFRLYDLESNSQTDFDLKQLPDKIKHFGFLIGQVQKTYVPDDPLNIKAAELMGELHDELKKNGYTGHKLEIYLVRLVFCLFADDTGIFDKDAFSLYIENKTNEDGSDLGNQIAHIFQILDTPDNQRQTNLDDDLKVLQYINGSLFREVLPIPAFDSQSRKLLLKCCHFDWSTVSPAIFGSLFQSVADAKKRRNLGEHYTSEKNILKTIKPLFLDGLIEEFEAYKNSKTKLQALFNKIKGLKFFDPACGCGNFLVIAYRELRHLELRILIRVDELDNRGPEQPLVMSAETFRGLDVDGFFGIEIEEFPKCIAEVALWLTDHLANMKLANHFGIPYVRLPLQASPTIRHVNALRIDWNQVVPASKVSYVMGNPPFKGKSEDWTKEQEADMETVCKGIKSFGVLDFVCAWYVKAAQYLKGTSVPVAFVSTNSITQGEQVSVLWNYLFPMGADIKFGHRTFAWDSQARGKANVHVVIIGFGFYEGGKKRIYDYENIRSEPHESIVDSISPYLTRGGKIVIGSRTKPLCMPEILMVKGCQPTDDGNLSLIDGDEKSRMIKKDKRVEKFIEPFIGDSEYLKGIRRWCLWLKGVNPKEWHDIEPITERVKACKEYRLKSKKAKTRNEANIAYLFTEIRQPTTEYILVPRHCSQKYDYIPMEYFPPSVIVGDSCIAIPKSDLFIFGVLSSRMHMAWTRQVCGRIKSDYRYSNKIVFNNFPWPDEPTQKDKKETADAVKDIFAARKKSKGAPYEILYDPLSMPKDLLDAHHVLDRLVDKLYRPQPFPNELGRLEFLFDRYSRLVDPLNISGNQKNKKGRKLQ